MRMDGWTGEPTGAYALSFPLPFSPERGRDREGVRRGGIMLPSTTRPAKARHDTTRHDAILGPLPPKAVKPLVLALYRTHGPIHPFEARRSVVRTLVGRQARIHP